MNNQAPQTAGTARSAPDCVTEVRMGNTVLIVKGYFKQDATETAVDKMGRLIASEGALHDIHRSAN